MLLKDRNHLRDHCKHWCSSARRWRPDLIFRLHFSSHCPLYITSPLPGVQRNISSLLSGCLKYLSADRVQDVWLERRRDSGCFRIRSRHRPYEIAQCYWQSAQVTQSVSLDSVSCSNPTPPSICPPCFLRRQISSRSLVCFFCPFLFFPKCSAIPIYYHPRGKGFHNYCRDHGATGSVKGINTGLNAYFFGDDLKGELTVERFLEFQRSLQEEILALEFKKKDEEGTGKIAEKDFADLLIAYAGFQPKKKARMLRRVRWTWMSKRLKKQILKPFHPRKAYDGEESQGVELKDYLNFYQVASSLKLYLASCCS